MLRGLLTPALARTVAAGVATLACVVGPAAGASTSATPCKPWQTAAPVPSGGFTARVFPTDEPSVPVAPSGTGSRTACRNAPPTPFTHPTWDRTSVVGGERLDAMGLVLDAPAGVPAPPEVYDVSYVIADAESGEILAAKSPHAWLRPASTLKTLTAVTLLPRLDLTQVVVASAEAVRANGSRVGMLEGNRYPVSALVDAMVMYSANDAVYALSDAVGGYARTVELMNAKAAELGAHDTVTVDPSGLDEGNQRSSAYDLAVIARAALELPAFRTAAVKRDLVFPGGTDRSGKTWTPFHVANINELLAHYPGAIGVKPGRTDRAQHTFIGAATRNGRTLIVSQMGSVTGSWKPTAALLDWGFANADKVTPVGRLVAPGEAAPPRRAATAPVSSSAASGTASDTASGTAPQPSSTDAAGAPTVGAGPTVGDGPLDQDTAVMLAAGAVSVALVGVFGLAAVVLVRRRRRRDL